jgi:hypothetical protein
MTAGPDDWKRLPFAAMSPIPYRATFDRAQFEAIAQGLVPEEMEDKWFAYFHDHALCLHRSWTGQGVYRLTFSSDGETHSVTAAACATETLEKSDAAHQAALVDFLICNLLLGQSKPFPRHERSTPGLTQFAFSGTTFPETAVAAPAIARAGDVATD